MAAFLVDGMSGSISFARKLRFMASIVAGRAGRCRPLGGGSSATADRAPSGSRLRSLAYPGARAAGDAPAAANRYRVTQMDVAWRQFRRQLPGSRLSDLAIPVTAGVVQLAGTYLTAGRLRYRLGAPGGAQAQGHLAVLGTLLPAQGHLTVLDWVLAAAGPVALTARRRHPVVAAWVAGTATLAPAVLWFGYLSLIVAFFTAAASGHRRTAWSVLATAYACSCWLAPLAWSRPVAPPVAALLAAGWLAVIVLAAEAARMRGDRKAGAAAALRLDARRRASEERLRMARELHDVIGHHVSLINLQAGVGLDLMDTRPEQARAALAAVKTVSGQALEELRALLCALREAGQEAPRAPVSGLARLPDLVSATRAAGLAVTTAVTGQARALPAPVDLAAYRIVQESLTNVARHAGPAAAVTVRLAYGEDDLAIEVTDDGPPSAARSAARGVHRGAPDSETGRVQGGTGIPGMRERAHAVGGYLAAGPRPGGGFQVSARLPVGGGS
jgi:signal transduction histidine kinase